jgi:hypothetical protein
MWTLVFSALAALTWLIELAADPLGASTSAAGVRWLTCVAIGFTVLAAVRLLLGFLNQLIRGYRPSGRTDLLQTVVSALVYLGAAFLYGHFELGMDVTGLLATSAALSLIAGLALQPTLGNLFAGISIELEHSVRVGDYVRRGALSGEVVSLSWRSVQLRSDSGAILILPNSGVTSDVLEIISRGQPYRHEVEFPVTARHAPGIVMQVAMRALQSGVAGVDGGAMSDVVLREKQSDSDSCVYAARFFVTSVARRNAIGSAVLERVWYELSRLEDEALAAETDKGVTGLNSALQSVLDRALGGVSPAVAPKLLAAGRLRRYGQGERYCGERGVALILQGVMSASRSADDAASELDEVLAEIAQVSAGVRVRTSDTRRLDLSSYQSLMTLGTRYAGPVSHRLCDRIASVTDDPWIAYRAFASFLPEANRREEFLASAPRRSSRSMPVGSWIRADPDDTVRAASQSYRAQTSCTLLVWNDPALVTHLLNLTGQ